MFQIENFSNLGLTKDEDRCIIYTTKKNKHKGDFVMNKMKKVLMTMFGLVMLPLLFACSNNQSAGIEAIKSKGKLVVALNPDFAPFEYQKVVDGKNQIVGSDIELAKAIATELGVELELSPMSFDNVLASVQSGKADLAISGVSKTDERSKVFDFSIPYYTAKK